MLQSLIEWMTGGIAETLDAIISMFLGAISPSLQNFIDTFPGFAAAYSTFQIIGTGFAVLIASAGLYQFFFMKGASSKSWVEQPWQVLVRTAVAGALIVGGGYICSYMVELGKFSYELFIDLDYGPGTKSGYFDYLGATTHKYTVTIFSSGLNAAGALGAGIEGLALSDLGIALLILLLDLMIGWELFKLMIEVAERYLMVGVLVYTSPLIFGTVASAQTEGIFKRWVQMFISSLIMMSLSVFFLNASISALGSIDASDNFMLTLILILAMLKIAQKVDSYLNQLGLTTAQTGGGMLDDLFAAARTMGGMARGVFGGRGGAGGVKGGLGGVASRTLGLTPAAQILKYGKNIATKGGGALLRGEGISGAKEAYKQANKEQFKRSILGAGIAAGKGQAGVDGIARNAVDRASYAVNGSRPFEESAAAAVLGGEAAKQAVNAQSVHPGSESVSEDFMEKVNNNKASAAEKNASFETSGVAQTDALNTDVSREAPIDYQDNFVMKATGEDDEGVALSDNARAAGLKLETASDNTEFVSGPDKPLQDFIDKATTPDQYNMTATGERAAAKPIVTMDDAANSIDPGMVKWYDDAADNKDGHYYQAAQAELRSDSSGTNMYGPIKDMSYANAEKVAYDNTATQNGGYYYMAAEAETFASGTSEPISPEKIEARAQEMQRIDVSAIESATIARSSEMRNSTVSKVAQTRSDMISDAQSAAEEYAPQIAANTINHASPTIARNVFATTDIPEGGSKSYGSHTGNAMFERAYNDVVSDKQKGSDWRNVQIVANTGHSGQEGRCVATEYTSSNGSKHEVRVYDEISKYNGVVPEGAVRREYSDGKHAKRVVYVVNQDKGRYPDPEPRKHADKFEDRGPYKTQEADNYNRGYTPKNNNRHRKQNKGTRTPPGR